jgi:adenine phosphoribosyltransferase
MNTNDAKIRSLIRTIPDFPKPGIMFRDVTTLFADAEGMALTIAGLKRMMMPYLPSKVIAIESRGFIIGGALAKELGAGLVLVRKRGKLPGKVQRIEYELEYGRDAVEIHENAITPGETCVVVDDLLATGGTCSAACELVERLGGHVSACGFIVNLPELNGHERINRYPTHWLVEFSGH